MSHDTTWPRGVTTIGVIGLGDLGRSIGRRLARDARKASVDKVVGFDSDKTVIAGLKEGEITVCPSIAHLVDMADLVHLCLPSTSEVAKAARSHEGLLDCIHRGQIIVDHGWSSLDLTRQLATAFASRGAAFLDAPIGKSGEVARAIEAGRAAFAIGGDKAAIDAALTPLGCIAGDITHVGPSGAAQVVRQMGDLVAFQTFSALAEAFVTARAFGIDGAHLLDALARGNGEDGGMGHHRLEDFLAVDAAPKGDRTTIADAGRRLNDAISLARGKDLDLAGAGSTMALFEMAREKGLGEEGLSGLFSVMEPKPKKRWQQEERRRARS